MIALPFAHVGHWAMYVVYAVPVVVVLSSIVVMSIRERRARRDEISPPPAP